MPSNSATPAPPYSPTAIDLVVVAVFRPIEGQSLFIYIYTKYTKLKYFD